MGPFPKSKAQIRQIAQSVLLSKIAPIVVASMGRSGSTLVHDAICRGLAEARFGHSGRLATGLVAGYAWDLSAAPLRNGVAYKTHALAEELDGRSDVKVVFLFGSAVDSAVSVINARKVKGDAWIASHFDHLRGEGGLAELAERDVLRFSDQLDGWTSLTSTPAIAMKYDSLWHNQDSLSDFLGFPIALPPRRERSAKQVDSKILKRLQQTYALLESRIAAMPDVIRSGPEEKAQAGMKNQ
ncbi:hypothetical protein [Pseudosulfitobacter pseudonitzschiae]|nr:hypothetical protein [Pseudosulfitobacter pseudonitzschiae]MBM1817362.1 hypothetical protein [Pseudosulfitobacter pseudonitzschiae]MBM1834560.1 hypothetical protein [Pseudosulfitobacter pseudonitzschiae]MBM1844275.1 hypothetical protein [Pseudosulfitobacter pseudonitzschiae]MBM1849110.1 hypothetical protein [Pseudosulfitobacter pseudonitzschiae]MBM1853970.1 hypothetical protein [Pseudosulfitobacter pseudonitzschiae]